MRKNKPNFISGKKVKNGCYEAIPICPACGSVLTKSRSCGICKREIDWSDE